ncbi:MULTISPECIES: DUF4350 domain-containing protein [Hymenobacter]|uniref:DUF4350 domain-containing protein n=1 Tax=Hymenobacter mucosus TaxID=1411120 RepID=A0A238W0Q0_9BACT|nr:MULTISPECIES: DUF4350 domain-containing protein [Hymenobacter]SNR40130.1 hypothetical protein SAMN06269173_102120 [Hymenobacter mucosus]
MSRFRLFLLTLGVLFVAFVAVEYFRPQPTDWTPTYINRDKIPYGTFVLYDALPDLFPGQDIRTTRLPIANQLLPTLDANTDPDSVVSSTYLPPLTSARASYLFVDGHFACSRLDQDALLRYAARGNTVFIAAESLDDVLADTLHLFIRSSLRLDSILRQRMLLHTKGKRAQATFTTLELVNPAPGSPRRFRFPLPDVGWHFVALENCRATVLARDRSHNPVLVRVPVGKGAFILSSTPAAFSNVALLQPSTAPYAFAALSQLPANQAVLWDEYQKQGPTGEQSLLRVIRQHEALRWAWYTGLVGLLIFVGFKARRRQRIIPIIKPLPNTTLLFTRTVASLYRQGSDHSLIANKKINLFREQLRLRLQEPNLDLLDESTRDRMAQKAGVPRQQVDELIKLIHKAQTAPQVSDADLLRLSRAISSFSAAAF